AGLDGKRATDWEGWAIPGADGKWRLALDDPFMTGLAPGPTPNDYAPQLDILIEPAADTPPLRLGQQVRLNGRLAARGDAYPPALAVTGATVSVLADRLAGLTAPADLADLVMRRERTACFGACPIYQAAVYSNGVVLWHGARFVDTPGWRIATIG